MSTLFDDEPMAAPKLETPIRFTVLGKAQTAGSKRGFAFQRKDKSLGTRMAPDNPKTKAWMHEVASVASESYTGPLLDCALDVEMVFFRPRSPSDFGTGRNAGVLRKSAPKYPTTKPDNTKTARAVEDALKGVIWTDDARVVDLIVRKRFGTPQRVEVTIRVLE